MDVVFRSVLGYTVCDSSTQQLGPGRPQSDSITNRATFQLLRKHTFDLFRAQVAARPGDVGSLDNEIALFHEAGAHFSGDIVRLEGGRNGFTCRSWRCLLRVERPFDGFIACAAQVDRLDGADRFTVAVVYGHSFADPLGDAV